MLKENPKLAMCEFYNGTTNPMCRATFLGHKNIVQLLLKFGADINKRSKDLRTPLMWASIRDNVSMIELLLEHSPDLLAVDAEGWNALDHAILKINYKAARLLTKAGLPRKKFEDYDGKTWRKYDI